MVPDGIKRCPVCETPADDDRRSGNCVCGACGFPNAYIGGFLEEKTAEVWKADVSRQKAVLIAGAQELCGKKNSFFVNGTQAIFISPVDNRMTIIKASGIEKSNTVAIQYSSAEDRMKNEAILTPDGNVISKGDNIYGQNNIGTPQNIKRVVATSDCTYLIDSKGKISGFGQPVTLSATICGDVVEMVAGAYFIAVLTKDNRVSVSGNMINMSFLETVNSWPRDIIKITACDDALIALRKNGTILFAGKHYDARRSAESWSGVTAVALESRYAVGLTCEGKILLAASSDSIGDYLDMGRKNAANWKDIVAIAASRSGIAGLDIYGTVHLVGNFRNIKKIQEHSAAASPDIKKDILAGIRKR